jgi:hypothetical protein
MSQSQRERELQRIRSTSRLNSNNNYNNYNNSNNSNNRSTSRGVGKLVVVHHMTRNSESEDHTATETTTNMQHVTVDVNTLNSVPEDDDRNIAPVAPGESLTPTAR